MEKDDVHASGDSSVTAGLSAAQGRVRAALAAYVKADGTVSDTVVSEVQTLRATDPGDADAGQVIDQGEASSQSAMATRDAALHAYESVEAAYRSYRDAALTSSDDPDAMQAAARAFDDTARRFGF